MKIYFIFIKYFTNNKLFPFRMNSESNASMYKVSAQNPHSIPMLLTINLVIFGPIAQLTVSNPNPFVF